MMPFEFVINGRPTRVDVPANMPLLWVIRDVLNLRGTKCGCGVALCGACTGINHTWKNGLPTNISWDVLRYGR